MDKLPNVTMIGGFGGSGSSVVADLLKETDLYYVMQCEFRLFVDPDGVMNLEDAIVNNWSIYQSDMAIKRFIKLVKELNKRDTNVYYGINLKRDFGRSFGRLVREYISDLTYLKYQGLWVGISTKKRRLIGVELKKQWLEICKKLKSPLKKLDSYEAIPGRQNDVSKEIIISKNLTEQEFLTRTKNFVSALVLSGLKRNNKERFVFDEGYVSMNPARIMRYLPENAKLVVVSRDPRDQYVNMRLSRWMYQPEELDAYIKYQKAVWGRWVKAKKTISKDKMLHIRFEDMGIDYKGMVKKIFKFLDIDPGAHIRPNTFVDVDRVKSKIGLWKKHLSKKQIDLLNNELGAYLKLSGYKTSLKNG